MKHFNANFIFALLVFSINVSLLNAQRHFYLNVSKQCLSAESALAKIQQEFEIDPNSHFKLINDTTDGLGMQHLTYKQYLYDFEIVGCMVLVHVKKGSVQSMNGSLLGPVGSGQWIVRCREEVGVQVVEPERISTYCSPIPSTSSTPKVQANMVGRCLRTT